MRSRLVSLALFALFGMASLSAQTGQAAQTAKPAPKPAAAPAVATTDLAVTVTYTGKGPVDAGHAILLFLFADPNIGPASQPLGPPETAVKNGATVTFKNVLTKPVYVVAVYNEKGDYNGQGGPPPAGTPIGLYAKDAKSPPTPVTPGPKAAIKLSFSDAKRWGK